MNGPIRKVSVLVMVMFLALMLNSTYAYVMRNDSLNNHPNNRRVRDAEFGTDRGDILVGNTAIASSVKVDGRYQYQRTYSHGSLYAPVTGFYSFLYGSSGLERSQNQDLAGTSSGQAIQRMLDQATGKAPVGASVQTTLNMRAQQAAAKGLGNRPGAVVALNYKTGEVLAMVSSPSYDPNSLASHTLEDSTKAWNALNANPNQPMLNRAIKNHYQPGSTFKVVVAAAALENGYTSQSQLEAPLSLRLPQSTAVMRNAGSCGGTTVTLDQALRVSCNTAFAQLGIDLGDDALRKQAEKFGFGRTLLPELGAVASTFPANPDPAQTAMCSIGQFEVAATPLQMAMVAGAVANNGVVMDPYIVSQVRGADLNVISTRRPKQLSRAMQAGNAQQLRTMMINVVDGGTGRNAKIAGVQVGGKTGTAVPDRKKAPYAWFIAFADDPNVAVAVFVQDAGASNSEISGGRYAAPIAKSVIEALR